MMAIKDHKIKLEIQKRKKDYLCKPQTIEIKA